MPETTINLKNRSLIFLLAGLALAGCQKLLDYAYLPGKGNAEFKLCEIRSMTINTNAANQPVYYEFTYDRKGRPLTVKNDHVGTGNPNAVFKYDKYGRLSEIIRPYSLPIQGFEAWNKYGYNNRNQIVRDTQYIFGNYFDSIPTLGPMSSLVSYASYEYDAQDRISAKTDSLYSLTDFKVANHFVYNYDNKGNLINGSTYDNKVSIRRTNKIWMFLARDFSVSNSFLVTKYNAYGLPESFQSDYGFMGDIIGFFGTIQVSYACQ